MPELDVCIPTYNRADMVLELISTIPQSWRVKVSDNGLFLSKSERCKSDRVEIAGSENVLDVFSNWARAADMANSDWFLFPSDDDLYYPNVQETIDSVLKQNPAAGMIVFGHNEIDANGRVLRSWVPDWSGELPPKEAFKFFACGVDARMPSVLFRKEAYQKCGGVRSVFKLTAGDSELIQRMSIRFPTMFVPTIISGYRVWEGGLTHKKIATKLWGDEIDLWMEMLDAELRETDWGSSRLFRRRIQDEIRLRNICAGLSKCGSRNEKFELLRFRDYPKLASLKTHLGVLKSLLKATASR